MPSIPPAVLRAPGVLVSTAPRRVAVGALVALALLAVAFARGAYTLARIPPSVATGVGLDALAVAAAVAAYGLATRRPASAPLRALYVLVASTLGLVALEWAVGAAAGGSVQRGGLASGLGAVAAGTVAGVAEGALAIAVALGLRALVLYRRGRWTVALWRASLVAAVAAALGWAGRPIDVPPGGPAVALDAGALVLGLALVLRQRWVAVLAGRQRLAAGALAFALCAALLGLLVLRGNGPGGLLIEGVAGEFDRIPASYVLSRSLGSLATLAMGVGALYGLTAGLVLVFQLPAAEPTRAGERRAFQALSGFAGRLLDRDALAAAIARGPVEAGLAEAAWVVLANPEQGDLTYRVAAAEGLTPEVAAASVDADALVRAAAEAARDPERAGPLVLGRAEADHRVRARPGSGLGSLVVLPLADGSVPDGGSAAAGGLPRGALVAARRTPDAFEADDVAALDAFAAQAAISLANADLVAGAIDRARLARELTLAREVQLRLFPQTLPDLPGLEIAADERPALEIGGDYYDAVTLSPTCAGVVVADVSGKGTAAAFHMAEMKGVFQVGARLTRAPAEFLCSAAEALAPSLHRGTFVSAAYAVVDAEAGTLAVARAGHCPPVHARDPALPGGGAHLLRGRGVALGLGSLALFRRTLDEQHVDLAPGDAFVLYTDGLVEARDAAGEEWGYTRLLDAVARHRCEPAQALLDALLAEHRAWSTTPDAPADDVTVVVLKWTGTDASVPPSGPLPSPPPP